MISFKEISVSEFNPGFKVDNIYKIINDDNHIGYVCTSIWKDDNIFIEWIEFFPIYRNNHLFVPVLSAIAEFNNCERLYLECSPEHIRFLYKGIIINQNKKLSQPTLKRRFFKKKAAFFSWPGLGKEWC